MLSERPEYNAKIRSGYLLGPVSYGGHATDPLIAIAHQAESIKSVFDLFKLYELFPNFLEIKTYLFKSICTKSRINSELCRGFLSFFLGVEQSRIRLDMVATYMSHMPSGSSANQFVHYAQVR